jgi:hypothetical protein
MFAGVWRDGRLFPTEKMQGLEKSEELSDLHSVCDRLKTHIKQPDSICRTKFRTRLRAK